MVYLRINGRFALKHLPGSFLAMSLWPFGFYTFSIVNHYTVQRWFSFIHHNPHYNQSLEIVTFLIQMQNYLRSFLCVLTSQRFQGKWRDVFIRLKVIDSDQMKVNFYRWTFFQWPSNLLYYNWVFVCISFQLFIFQKGL